MAIYHFSGQVISRSQGRSCIAAAAYRSAEKIYDERTELTHNFTKKEHDILYKEVLLPENAPEKFKDRKTLWNEVERAEKRKDAQLCREFNIALPKELTPEQNIELIKEFTQGEFVKKGMIADICIHRGHNKGEDQPHAHIMLTQREVTENGFGQKNRDWNSKELMLDWRESWAETANKHLFLNGYDITIDHRTLEEQGINLEPQSKIGPTAAREYMARLEEHQQIAKENGERILKDPKIALDAITRQQSTFAHQDLARFVNRHTVDKEQFSLVYEKLKSCSEIIKLGLDKGGLERYTTQEMLETEKKMLDHAAACKENTGYYGKESLIKSVSEKLGLTEDQNTAYKHIVGDNGLSCITGFAGSGKSYVLKAANAVWQEKHHVIGMTLSGIAAENLESGSGIKSYTVANRLLTWENDRERLTSKDIVVIDEAGMLGSRQMEKILAEAHKAQAKVVMVGDPEQLQAIEAGAAYRAISEQAGSINLTDIRRQIEPWQQEATKDLATGKTADALYEYERKGHVHDFKTKIEAMDAMVEKWDETRSNQPDKSLIMLAYTRSDVKELNERAREVRQQYNELGTSQEFNCNRGVIEFAEGDKIYFLKNDKELGVKNGTLGIIESIDNHNFTVKTENKTVSFNINDYNNIDHGYAATIHKAQGVTVDRSYVLASKYFDRHAAYVAMTRHKDGMELFYSRDEFPSFDNLEQTLGRERLKDVSMDYMDSRGIENPEQIQTQHKPYDISQDRLQAAEERLLQRAAEKHMANEIKDLEQYIGRKVSMELEDGEKGIFRGVVSLDDKKFAILQQGDRDVKLVGYEFCRDLNTGDVAVIHKSMDREGKEHFDVREFTEFKQGRQMESQKTQGIQKELHREKSLEMEMELER